jgi:hypothetical protein
MPNHQPPPRLLPRRLLPALAGCALAVLTVHAQSTAVSATADAKALAKYDKNGNGKLDPDELAVMQADEARAAKAGAAAPAGAPAAPGEEVVALSPFEVNAADEQGYAAHSSMSGTRLNSKLEDIASSISVVTKQQLLDTAAIDINDIFQYEVGTEGTAQFTDPTNDGRGNYDNVQGNPTGANRVRGLAQAGILVGGFAASSSIPIDPYNIDSVEISRGPNSTTAGLSDAGGTVNLNLSKGNLTRNISTISTRVDSYDGFRVSMDLNRPLFRDKLAVRFSAVYNETGYVRKPSVDRTNRQQFAVTYRPFKKTTFNGSFEMFHEYAQRANALTPRDTISNWRAAGSPTYDWGGGTFAANGTATGGRFTINGVVQAPITTMTGNVPNGIALLGSSNARNVQYIDGGQIYAFMRGGQPNNTASAIDQFTESAGVSAAGPLYTLPGTTDRSIYDWTKYNIGAQNYELQNARLYNLSLDQEIFQTQRSRMDLNAAWRRENQFDYKRQFIAQQDGVPAVLEVDTNARLVDGRPNPFFLHPFIGGLAPQVYVQPNFTDSYRAQLAYQLDFSRDSGWKKWLGTHRWTTYGETSTRIYAPSSLRYHDTVVDNPNFLGTGILSLTPTSNFSANNGGLFFPLYYYGKTPGGGVEYANTGPVNPNGKTTVGSYFNTTTNQWVTGEPTTQQEVYFSQGKQKKIVRTLGGSFQDFWLDGRLVTTFGQREDRTYIQDNLPLNLSNGFYDLSNLDNFGINKKYLSGVTRAKGAVLKPFRGIPFIEREAAANDGFASYVAEAIRGFNFNISRSNTFLPADLAYNLFLAPLPNPTSEGKEFGFTINMFNRFSLRLTHQETTQIHTRAGTGTIATRVLGMDFHPGGQNLTFNLFDATTGWQQQLHPEYSLAQAQDAAAQQIGYSLDFINNAGGKTIADASDAASKGWELELQFNPTRFWTMKLTGNKQEAIDSNISLFIQQYINQRLPIWTSVKAPDGSLWWTTTQGSNGRPVDYYTLNIQTPLNLAITTQGKKKPQTREYSFAYVSSYQLAGLTGLTDGHPWLRSVTLGGSYRWSSRGAIGYLAGPADSDGVVRTLDPNKPVYDKARDNLSVFGKYRTKLFRGRIGTTFQLNVNNVMQPGGHLQPTAVNPDGSPWRFRIIDPRQFIASATFDL